MFKNSKSNYHAKGFDQFYKQHQKPICKYGLRILNDTYVIENIVQDAFLKLWDFRDTITSEEHAERFLKQSVKWACYAYFRNAGSRFHRYMIQLDACNSYDDLLGEVYDDAVLTDTDYDLQEQRIRNANEAIAKVCYGREKEVIELYFVKGLSNTQIAARYHLSVPTVNMILEKGKLRLKTILVTARDQSPVAEHRGISGLIQTLDSMKGLNPEQNAIYQLRLTGRYNFEQIAAFLQLPLDVVQTEYVRAWKIAGGQKKKNSSAKRGNSNAVLPSRLLSA